MIILDLDNCISDDEWRKPRINMAHSLAFHRYHNYHSLAGFDRVGNRDLFTGRLASDVAIITARPVHYRAITETWLNINCVPYSILMMRDDNDHRSAVSVKDDALGWMFAEHGVKHGDIEMAYDDRIDTIAMYLRNGLPATQVWLNPPKHIDEQQLELLR